MKNRLFESPRIKKKFSANIRLWLDMKPCRITNKEHFLCLTQWFQTVFLNNVKKYAT